MVLGRVKEKAKSIADFAETYFDFVPLTVYLSTLERLIGALLLANVYSLVALAVADHVRAILAIF